MTAYHLSAHILLVWNRRTGLALQDCANHSPRATGDSAKLRLLRSDDLRVKTLKEDKP